jgi:hypothetical protein
MTRFGSLMGVNAGGSAESSDARARTRSRAFIALSQGASSL